MSNSDNRPTTAAAPPLSKEAPVHLNEVCNDCNEKQDCLLVFSQQQHFPSHVGRRKKKEKTAQGELNYSNLQSLM